MFRWICILSLLFVNFAAVVYDAVNCEFENDTCGWTSPGYVVYSDQDVLVCGLNGNSNTCFLTAQLQDGDPWRRSQIQSTPLFGFPADVKQMVHRLGNISVLGTMYLNLPEIRRQMSDIVSVEIPLSTEHRCLHYHHLVIGKAALIVAYITDYFQPFDLSNTLWTHGASPVIGFSSNSVILPVGVKFKLVFRSLYDDSYYGLVFIINITINEGICQFCGPGEFRCSRSRDECVPLTKVCDFKSDCLNKEDEQQCDFVILNNLCNQDQGLKSTTSSLALLQNRNDNNETDVNVLDTRLNLCYIGQPCPSGFSNTCHLPCPTGCYCSGLSFICTSHIAPVFATSITIMGLKQNKLEFSTYSYDKIYRKLIELKIIDCELQNLKIVGLVPIQKLTISNSTIDDVYIEDGNNYLQYFNIVNSDIGELKFDLLGGFKILGFDFYVHKSSLRKIVSTQYLQLSGVHVHMSEAFGFPFMVNRFFNEVVNLSFCYMLDPPYSRQNIITLDLSHNLLKTWEISAFVRILHLQHNLIETVNFTGDLWHSQARLMYLDLSYNIIEKINKEDFVELPNLFYLKLQNNRLIHVHENAFQAISKLLHLDLSNNHIRNLKRSHFIYLSNLQHLYLKNNNIKVVEGMFDGLINIQYLQVDSFTFCCAQPKAVSKINCSAPVNEISSCYNLIDTPLLTIIIWYIAILAVFGNLLGLIYRFLVLKEKTVSPFVIYSINLGIADFLMGMYLYIIAGANLVFSGRYGFEDDLWRHSPLCVFAGVAATLSSEASALFVLSITVDRILLIRFPFSRLRKNHWVPKIVSSSVWTLSLLLALIPLTGSGYFTDYYSNSGICITLPLSVLRKSGWEYSMSIFVGANFLIFIAIFIGQIVIFVDVVRMGKEVSSQRNMQGRRELSLAKTLIAVAMTDMLCWIPIGVIGLLTFLGIDVTSKVYAWVVVVVLPINSALNPIIYTFSAIIRRRAQQNLSSRLSYTRTRESKSDGSYRVSRSSSEKNSHQNTEQEPHNTLMKRRIQIISDGDLN